MDEGAIRKAFRAFTRAWWITPPEGKPLDRPVVKYQLNGEVCLADWRELDSGPVIQRAVVYNTTATDARGQCFTSWETAPGQLWRINRITASAPDGSTGLEIRVGWWIDDTSAPGTYEDTPAEPEGQGLKGIGQFRVNFGDLNSEMPVYHFGRIGAGEAKVKRLWHPMADGDYLHTRIDTGAGAGNAIRIAIEIAALRTDEIQQLIEVGRNTYRGD